MIIYISAEKNELKLLSFVAKSSPITMRFKRLQHLPYGLGGVCHEHIVVVALEETQHLLGLVHGNIGR